MGVANEESDFTLIDPIDRWPLPKLLPLELAFEFLLAKLILTAVTALFDVMPINELELNRLLLLFRFGLDCWFEPISLKVP